MQCNAACAYCNLKMYLFRIVASSIYLLCKTASYCSSHVHDTATFLETIVLLHYHNCSCMLLFMYIFANCSGCMIYGVYCLLLRHCDHGFESHSECGWISIILQVEALQWVIFSSKESYHALTKEIHRPENRRHLVILVCIAIQIDLFIYLLLFIYCMVLFYNVMFWHCCGAIVQWYQTPDKVKELWLAKIVNW